MKRSQRRNVRRFFRINRSSRSRQKTYIEILESRCVLSAEIMDYPSELTFEDSSLTSPQVVIGNCQAGSSQDAQSDSIDQQYRDAIDSLHCSGTISSVATSEEVDLSIANSVTISRQTSWSPELPIPSMNSPSPSDAWSILVQPPEQQQQIDSIVPPLTQPINDPSFGIPSVDGSSDGASGNVTLPPMKELSNGSFGSESLGNASLSNSDSTPRPQISPAPQVAMTVSLSVAPQAIGIEVANPLRDISEFLTTSHPQREVAIYPGSAAIPAREDVATTHDRLAARLNEEKFVESTSLVVNRRGTVSIPLQSKPQMASVTVLMPILASGPRQSAAQNVSADVNDETIDASIPIPKEEASKSDESVKAEIPGAGEKQLGRRASTLLGIMIASIVGMPHTFRQRLVRQRIRVTTLGNFDHYS